MRVLGEPLSLLAVATAKMWLTPASASAYTAANAFGQFAAALADFDASKLHAVIPDFHNLAMRC